MRHLSSFHVQQASEGIRGWVTALAVLCFASSAQLPAQQFRAAWADVFHNGMQSSSQVDTMVSSLVTGRYNAVVVQVLAYMDNAGSTHGAYWKSSVLPSCSYVTSNFDPLAYLCTAAHANGLQVYAWMGGSCGGIYRVSLAWPPAGNPTLASNPQWMMVPITNCQTGVAKGFLDGGSTYSLLDMGSPDAQEYLVSIVKELVSNYAIDGIAWD